jgi:dihydroorotate dehydrogenase
LLFLLDAETAHHFSLKVISLLGSNGLSRAFLKLVFPAKTKTKGIELAGLRFPNRIGLAAGLDKNATAVKGLGALGFGFIEIGTVTPKPQPGNDKPRLFRLPADQALVNRMGFNNDGADVIRERLRHRPTGLIVGGNIGRNKSTPNEDAIQDYLYCIEALKDVVDYFVINISSPNTPGLRHLQDEKPLRDLLRSVVNANKQLDHPKPVFVKIAPDLTDEQVREFVNVVLAEGVEGIIATNTSITREGLTLGADELEKMGPGGLSGKPVSARSTEVLRIIRETAGDRLVLVASGGVMDIDDARAKAKAGADLIQVYTGFIYKGPGLIRQLVRLSGEMY